MNNAVAILAKIPRLSLFIWTIRLLNPQKTTEIKAGVRINEGLDLVGRAYSARSIFTFRTENPN